MEAKELKQMQDDLTYVGERLDALTGERARLCRQHSLMRTALAVSYTHLTLPTILRV